MNRRITQKASAGDHSVLVQAGGDVISNVYTGYSAPQAVIDSYVAEQIAHVGKTRYFTELRDTTLIRNLAKRLADGDLRSTSEPLKARAIALCCRYLAGPDQPIELCGWLETVRGNCDVEEVSIATAFVASANGDFRGAIDTMSKIDSPLGRSSRLTLTHREEGNSKALHWFREAGYDFDGLDAEGRSLLISLLLDQKEWDIAWEYAGSLTDDDFEDCPVLLRFAALTELTRSVPEEFMDTALNGAPINLDDFPLAGGAEASKSLDRAIRMFERAESAFIGLGAKEAAYEMDEYALWLRLRDPRRSDAAHKDLKRKLTEEGAYRFIRFAIRFGVEVDSEHAQRDLQRVEARRGEITPPVAIAKVELAQLQPSPSEAAAYLSRHHEQLSQCINEEFLFAVRVELHCKAQEFSDADVLLNQLIDLVGDGPQVLRVRRIIEAAQARDPASILHSNYAENGDLDDLIVLVRHLERVSNWIELTEYSGQLFERTRSIDDAERHVRALINSGRSESVLEFSASNTDLLDESDDLRLSHAWALYNEGKVRKAIEELNSIGDWRSIANGRSLQFNISVASGDWASLVRHVADEFAAVEERSPLEILSAARVALHIESPHAKALLFRAAKEGEGNAQILADAYFMACTAGWETEPEVGSWIQRAVGLSEDEGPMVKMSLEDLVERQPSWNDHQDKINSMQAEGAAPIFLVGESLNLSLCDQTLAQAFRSADEPDVRRRGAVPAFGGARQPTPIKVNESVLALDISALLTLGRLRLLSLVLNAARSIVVAHSTMALLFEEQFKAKFHQPSRIKNARIVRDLLVDEKLGRFEPHAPPSSDLASEVGLELAALLCEAAHTLQKRGCQALVVRPAPVFRLGSLMKEELPLVEHSNHLVSCGAVVERLKQKGLVNQSEFEEAMAYLALKEKAWPDQPAIVDGATVYLDDLAVTHFLHLGLLERLAGADFKPVLSPSEESDAAALIDYEKVSESVRQDIEYIRATLAEGVVDGAVELGRIVGTGETASQRQGHHPTEQLFGLLGQCDAVVVDDRAFNQHLAVEHGGHRRPALTSLDLVDALFDAGKLTAQQQLDARTRLRRSGYFFIDFRIEEMASCLQSATIADGELLEPPELRAIRESVLRVRMSSWLQIPRELHWLNSLFMCLIQTVRLVWQNCDDVAQAKLRSAWALRLLDIQGWAHLFDYESVEQILVSIRALHLSLLITLPDGLSEELAEAYWQMLEDEIVEPTRQYSPETYSAFMAVWRRQIEELIEQYQAGGDSE